MQRSRVDGTYCVLLKTIAVRTRESTFQFFVPLLHNPVGVGSAGFSSPGAAGWVSNNGVFYRKFSGVCSWMAGLRVVGNTATFCAHAPAGPWCALHHVRVRLPLWQPRSASRCTQPCHAGIAPAHAL